MNHKKMQILVSAYVDSEVRKIEKTQVLLHLDECSECRAFVADAKRMKKDIAALGEVKLANSFAANVEYALERREERTLEWLIIEPLARNTVILLAGFVLILFLFMNRETNTASILNDQLLTKMTSNSVSTHVLLQQEHLSKSDLLYAVMTK